MKQLYAVVLSFLLTVSAQGQIITQWNFNGTSGTTTPSTGSGSVLAVGGVSTTFASGSVNSGSSDPVAPAANQAYNLAGFPASGTGNKTAGLEIQVSTIGKQNVKLSFDLRLSATAANLATIQYSTDGGGTYVDFQTLTINSASTWVNNSTFDFSSVTALNNNANTRFRIVSTFNTTQYQPISGTYGASGTYRFDMVTVQGMDIPLPVTYYTFNARYTESKTVVIAWTTATERDNAHFEVERSADVRTFQTIGRVDGKGTTDVQQQYTFIDETPMPGWNYYRLNQVDTDGKTSLSKVLAVLNETALAERELSLWPNPAESDLHIRLTTNATIETALIYDMQGHWLNQPTIETNRINVSMLPTGMYLLEIRTTDYRTLRQRFLKL